MSVPTSEFRIELLRDGLGIYGWGSNNQEMSPIITRPDKIKDYKTSAHEGVAYQMIPYGQGGCFRHTKENGFIDLLYDRMRNRRIESDESFGQWDGENRIRNLRIHHGLKKGAYRIVNRHINEALTVADQQALATVRKFPLDFRGNLYPAFCFYGMRAMQLAETFPALALLFFSTRYSIRLLDGTRDNEGTLLMRKEGRKMVLRGDQLKLIAQMAGVPMAFRAVKPRVAGLALKNIQLPVHLLHQYLPKTTWAQKAWLQSVHNATEFGPEFTEWTAKNVINLGRTGIEMSHRLIDIGDWVRASILKAIPNYVFELILNSASIIPRSDYNSGCEFVTRPFSKDMSIRTVSRLSQEWHGGVSSKMTNGKLMKQMHR